MPDSTRHCLKRFDDDRKKARHLNHKGGCKGRQRDVGELGCPLPHPGRHLHAKLNKAKGVGFDHRLVRNWLLHFRFKRHNMAADIIESLAAFAICMHRLGRVVVADAKHLTLNLIEALP